MRMPTIFVALVGVNSLGARIVSETTRGSLNVEVAVAVDVTGSMNETISTSSSGGGSRTKMAALKDALNALIDIVVQDEQKPTYSKMAIVPYSASVNLGSYADSVRGAIRQPTAITNVAWSSSAARSITTTTFGSPVEITTSVAHGFVAGDYVFITGVSTMTAANNQVLRIRAVTALNKFTLNNVNGTAFSGSGSKSGSGGTVTRCTVSTCDLVVTSPNHGLSPGENVYITGAGGMSTYNSSSNPNNWFNNNPNGDGTATANGAALIWPTANMTINTFSLPGSGPTRNLGTYSSGGTVSCVMEGCTQYFFRNGSSADRRHIVTTCISERTTNAFTDASPQTTLIGRNYASSANPCLPNKIVPLTSSKKTLHDLANGLTAVGSTAGHLGVGWAWYMVSPNFNGPWPTASQPAAASTPNVLRAVVLMTDGDFNTAYCNGVISNVTSTTGSGDAKNKINCAAPNGSAFTQAEKLCTEMKRTGIRVYTVGLDVADLAAAKQIMANCATDASHAYEATTSTDLANVFADIGRKLSFLRVTK